MNEPQKGAQTPARPKRIQRRRVKGWRMPDNAVYVGRGSKWGNPFRVGPQVDLGEVETNDDAVRFFRDWWLKPFNYVINPPPPLHELLELSGKDLACWCSLDTPCHADVLLRVVERMEASV